MISLIRPNVPIIVFAQDQKHFQISFQSMSYARCIILSFNKYEANLSLTELFNDMANGPIKLKAENKIIKILKSCTLEVVNNFHFKFPTDVSSCPEHILNLNASLAVTLCQNWLSIKHNNNIGKSLSKDVTEVALFNCTWPGRFQTKYYKTNTYYLDGAHTLESIIICSNWFRNSTKNSTKKKVLIFNVTGDRNAEKLLKQLQNCKFDVVLFVTNVASASKMISSNDELLERCHHHKQLWLKMERDNETTKESFCEAFSTVGEAIDYLSMESYYYEVLITGSLQLVGSVLSVMDPNLNEYS